jgi:hypothetical protein
MSNRPRGMVQILVSGLLSAALLWGCGPEQTQLGETVPVNLSLVLDHQEARGESRPSLLVALVQQWLFGVATAWAQSVSDIATIEVQVSGPDLPVPRTAAVSVSNPTSGQVIPVSIQAPVGSNRTIAVAALNSAGEKIYSGSISGVTLEAGEPRNLEIRLAPTFTVTVQKQGAGNGTVTSSPAGIDCGGTCSMQFDAGSSVALTASAAPGSIFAGWSGAGCAGTGPCTVSGNATVTAIFQAMVGTGILTVSKSGSGSGTVTSSPSGISCGTTCSASFASSSTVTLTASPTGGSTFEGWSGACSGTGSCLVVMNGDQTVNAHFTAAPATALLTVTKTGNGTVTSAPGGINCGMSCSESFASGSTVTLTASPTGGSTFGGWSGGGCSGTGSCVVVMNGNQGVTATFVPPAGVTLTVTKAGTGSGMVSSSPAGINGCTATCTASFPSGTAVTLTASPTGGSTFGGWSGGGCSGTGSCVVVMTGSQAVTATFVAPPGMAILTVTKTGAGTGTVSSTPSGIDNCATTCTASFLSGSTVMLTASPTEGSTFGGWSGGGCSGTGSCIVVMTGNQAVTATFNPPPGPAILTVTKTGTGMGTVTSTPAGINCGPTCSASFVGGSTVTLTATTINGSTFVGWSGGGCSGTGTCATVMSGNQTVVAQFDENPDLATLTVTKTGSGSGTVTSMPTGIDCGMTCTFSFARDTTVTLTATADGDSEFEDWSGSDCTGDGTCVVVMSTDRSVTAEFERD